MSAEQTKELLSELNQKKNEIDEKLQADISLKEDLQRQLLNLAEDLENNWERLNEKKKTKRTLDYNLSETEDAIAKLEETAAKLSATMQKMRKKG